MEQDSNCVAPDFITIHKHPVDITTDTVRFIVMNHSGVMTSDIMFLLMPLRFTIGHILTALRILVDNKEIEGREDIEET